MILHPQLIFLIENVSIGGYFFFFLLYFDVHEQEVVFFLFFFNEKSDLKVEFINIPNGSSIVVIVWPGK